MSWYRFYADHGPGHQSYSEKFVWITDKGIKFEPLESRWNQWCDDITTYGATGDVEKLDALPEKERVKHLEYWEATLDDAMAMIKRLQPPKEPRTTRRMAGCGHMVTFTYTPPARAVCPDYCDECRC